MIRNLLDNAWIDNRIKKEKIVHEVYINYEKQRMFIGRANMEEYVDLQPSSCVGNRNETDVVNVALDFLQKADFLLLAEDNKIKNNYLAYLKKRRKYYQECMSMDR